MRHTLVASLLLTPMLIPAAAYASKPKADDTAPAQAIRVSTGVTVPELLSPKTVAASVAEEAPNNKKVVLSLQVDTTGKAEKILIVKSAGSDVDSRVLEAVRGFRFRPGTVSNQAVPENMKITVVVQ
jgi:TonB family protein